MALIGVEQVAIGGIPHLHRFIGSRRSNILPIRRPGYRPDPVAMTTVNIPESRGWSRRGMIVHLLIDSPCGHSDRANTSYSSCCTEQQSTSLYQTRPLRLWSSFLRLHYLWYRCHWISDVA